MTITTREVSHVTIVDIRGRITLGDETGNLRDAVRNLIATDKKKIVLNLAQVDYIDSSGVGELVSSFTTVRNSGGELKLLSLSKSQRHPPGHQALHRLRHQRRRIHRCKILRLLLRQVNRAKLRMRLLVKFRGFPVWLHSNRVAFVSSACALLFCMPFAPQSSFAQSPEAHPAESTGEQAPSADAPRFKSSSNLVLVPTVVRDRQGKPLAGLTKDVFRLEENGKSQTISLFEEVHASEGDSPPYPSPELGYSNLPFDNASQQSLVIIVLDLLSTKPIQREDGKQLMTKFLSSRLPPGQMVAELSITSKGLQSIHPFSTDTKSLIEALRKAPAGAETIMARPNVVDTTIGAITELAQAYAGIEGRKTMIFAAGNIAELVSENQIRDSSAISDSLRRMWRSLIAANISIYPIGLMDWAARPDQASVRREFSVNSFADATGGGRCVESNDLIGCLAEAVEDSRSYYMLGFSVQPEDRKPGWRDLKVKVSVEHASVSARNGFYYGTPPVEQAKRPEELKALASALPQSAIPMFVKVLGPPPPSAMPNSADGKKTIAFRITIPLNGLLIDASSRSRSRSGSRRDRAHPRQEGTERSGRIHSTRDGQSQAGKSPDVGQGRTPPASHPRPAARLLRPPLLRPRQQLGPHRHRRVPARSKVKCVPCNPISAAPARKRWSSRNEVRNPGFVNATNAAVTVSTAANATWEERRFSAAQKPAER